MHVVNCVLQENRVTKEVMDMIAGELDAAERRHLLQVIPQGTQQTSEYFSAFGDYHVDVIIRALGTCDVTLQKLISIDLPPFDVSAYVIQIAEHWLALRLVNNVWWNLNSLLSNPEVIENFNLAEYITNLEAFKELQTQRKERASVYYVVGRIPPRIVSVGAQRTAIISSTHDHAK